MRKEVNRIRQYESAPRISKTRKRKRRTHYKIVAPGMNVCKNCGEVVLSHTVCRFCGFYDGKQVKTIKEKAVDAE